MNIVTDKRGYMTIEASIVLPIFIIAVLTLAFSMRIIRFQETAVFTAGNEARLLMQSAAVMPLNPSFPMKLEDKVENELPELKSVNVTNYSYRYGEDDLISFNVILESNTGLPGKMTGDYRTKHAFIMRAFSGKDNSLYPDIIYAEEDATVYVLPEYGTKYHSGNCVFITPHPFKTAMSDKIKEEYRPCEKCKPHKFENLTDVYIFKYGASYHIGTCKSIQKYVIEISKSEAIEKGYAPCMKCGGNN